MNEIRVRKAVAGDIPALAALGTRVFIDAYGETTRPQDMRAHIDAHFSESAVGRAMAADGVEYLAAADRSGVVGFVKMVRGAAPAAVPDACAVEVRQLYVATESQRRGVGAALVQAAIGRARALGAAGVWLSVWSEAGWATAFYRRCGFRAVGNATFTVGRTRYLDDLMWRPVSVD